MPNKRKPAAPCCEHCGGPLECFEGEDYCPDCTYFEAREQLQLMAEEDQQPAAAEAEDLQPVEADDCPPF